MTYRTFSGAAWDDVRTIPCLQLADALDRDAMTTEEEAARWAEIARRGAAFENHIGSGDAPRLAGWGGIPVVGCDHSG